MKSLNRHFWIYSLAAIFVTFVLTLSCERERFFEPELSSQEMFEGSDLQISPLSIPEGERFLIGFHETPDINVVRGVGGDVYRTFTIVPVVAARLSLQAKEALEKNPKVRYVEADGEVHAIGQSVPWGIDRVFGDESHPFATWGITKGGGIAVAIIDTGIDENHVDLPDLKGGTTTVDDTHWGSDGSGHGTHVAGTVAALDNDLGVVGVGPEIGLYAVKVLDDGGGGTVSSVVAGIEWAANNENISVLNMSLGSGSSSTTLKEACDAAYGAGKLLVAAAGNSGNPGGRGDNVGYPAAYESVIAVAASTINDSRASYSSTGPAVELIAPGSSIESTTPGNNYDTYSGTSMASPHVAGVAALAWASNSTLSNVQIRTTLQETAEDLGLSSNHQGYGLARADMAVDALSGSEPAVTYTITATAGDGGTIDPSGEVKVNEGEDQTFSITPDSGYEISDVTVDGTSVGAVTSYTFKNVADNHTIHAAFEINDETVSPLTIDKFELTNTSNPAWAKATVDWAVSGSNLASVKSEMFLDGLLIDSATTSVSGSDASGTHDLRNRGGHGKTYEVTLTVTDTDGNEYSETKSIEL